MSRVLVLFSLISIVSVSSIPAQSLRVEYSEGAVEVTSGTGWDPVAIGDTIGSEATIRLEGGASLELSASGSKIILAQPGTYAVKALLFASRDIGSSGVGKLLAQKVSSVVSTRESNRSTVAGIRGEMTRGGPNVRSELDDAAAYLDAGKRAIEEANYDRAILEFQSAREYADASQALKRTWYERMRGRDLRVKPALDDRGTVEGMIRHGLIENVAPFEGARRLSACRKDAFEREVGMEWGASGGLRGIILPEAYRCRRR